MKLRVIVSVASMMLMSICSVYAQSEDELKTQMNKIKRSSDYIYGQAAGEDEKACYETAHENFMRKFKEYIQNDSSLKGAEAVIMPTINRKVKSITFERNINSKVVCLYVNKKDIVPIYERNVMSLKEAKSDSTSLPTGEQNVIVSEVPQTTATLDVAPSKVKEIQVGDEKAAYLLNVIAISGNFDMVRKVLEQRIDSEHDIIFKATMTYSAENAYWAVFDKKKKLIALLDKERKTDLLTNQKIDSATYSDKPKIWIQIY